MAPLLSFSKWSKKCELIFKLVANYFRGFPFCSPNYLLTSICENKVRISYFVAKACSVVCEVYERTVHEALYWRHS